MAKTQPQVGDEKRMTKRAIEMLEAEIERLSRDQHKATEQLRDVTEDIASLEEKQHKLRTSIAERANLIQNLKNVLRAKKGQA